jgi:hypothetical protein
MSGLGDLLIQFGAAQPHLPARLATGTWAATPLSGGATVWQCSCGRGWKGFPFRRLRSGDDWEVWLLGELYGWGGDLAALTESFGDIVRGRQTPAALNGHWLALGRETSSGHWHVWTNRHGTIHAYYAQSATGVALGTFFPAVAAAASERRLDWTGLCGFFSFGFFPQDLTFFQDVRVVRPATHLVLDAHGRRLKEERYWRWSHEPMANRSFEETVEEFAARFRVVMGELLREGRVAIPISGGLDSRSTVAEIDPAVPGLLPRLWAYSYGYTSDSEETRIAREVARARGLPFEAFVVRAYLFDRLNDVLASVEGFQDVTQSRQASVTEHIANHAEYLLAAHWGDVWLDDMGLVGAGTSRATAEEVVAHTLKKMRKRGSRWLLDNLYGSVSGPGQAEELQHQLVADELSRLEDVADPDFRVKAFKTENWSFRWTLASIRMFQGAAFPRLPFYDNRLSDFFRTVPSEFVRGRRLQIAYLKRVAPELARIRWQVYDADLYSYHRFHSWHLPKRAVKKAWRLIARRSVIQRNWEVQFLHEQGQAGLVAHLVRPGLRLHQVVEVRRIRRLLDDLAARPSDPGVGYSLAMLLTFAAWLERYG